MKKLSGMPNLSLNSSRKISASGKKRRETTLLKTSDEIISSLNLISFNDTTLVLLDLSNGCEFNIYYNK